MGKLKISKATAATLLAITLLATCFSPPVAQAANSMLIDGTPGSSAASSVSTGSISASMTTTRSNNILIAYVGWESGGGSSANSQSSSVVSASGRPSLTWTLRTRYQNGGDQTQEIWWAVAPTPGTYGVQINWINQVIDDASLIIFAVNGANTTSPWEGSSATKLPLGSISGNYSTTYANTFVLTFYGNEKATQVTGPIPNGTSASIASKLNNAATWWEYIFVAGAAVSSSFTNQTWGWSGTSGTGGTQFAAVIIDALRDANYIEIDSVTFEIGSSVVYNTGVSIQATIPSAYGRVTIFAKNKPIAGCKNRKVGGSNSFSCSWKPNYHGQVPVYVSYVSDGGQQFTSATKTVNVTARQTTR